MPVKRFRGGKRRGTGASLPVTKFVDEWNVRNAKVRRSTRQKGGAKLPTGVQLRNFLQQLSFATGDPMVADFSALMENYGLLDAARPSHRIAELRDAIFGGRVHSLQQIANWYRAHGKPESTIVQATAMHDYEARGAEEALINTGRAIYAREQPIAPNGSIGTVFVRPDAAVANVKMHPVEDRPIRPEGELVPNTRSIRRRLHDGSLVIGSSFK